MKTKGKLATQRRSREVDLVWMFVGGGGGSLDWLSCLVRSNTLRSGIFWAQNFRHTLQGNMELSKIPSASLGTIRPCVLSEPGDGQDIALGAV